MFGIPGWVKYLGAGVLAIGIVLGIYFYGHHEGGLVGRAEVATLTQRIAENSAQFERDKAAEKQREQDLSDKDKQDLQNEQLKHKGDVDKLTTTIVGMRQQSSNYVAAIERLQGDQGKAACNAALELANRQYGEVADALRETSDRADSAAAIANTLNAFNADSK